MKLKSALYFIHLFPIFLGLVAGFSVFGEVRFSSNRYDFGTIREEGGPKRGSVSVLNLGPGPTYIRYVRTTCGCTDASFTEGLIEEGDSAIVAFTYDPEGRPGSFDKRIKVFVGEDNKMHTIEIIGTVVASRQTLSFNFPDSIGKLRLSTLMIDGGEIARGESRNYFVRLYNPTDRIIRPVASASSEVLSLAVEPPTIGPGETSVLGIYVNSRREPALGPHKYDIEICSDADATISEMGRVAVGVTIQDTEP